MPLERQNDDHTGCAAIMIDREIELKLQCTPEAMERLRGAPYLRENGMAVGRKRMRSVYFDTDDLRLGANGFALRLRFTGDKCIQTLKAGNDQTATSVFHDTQEFESLLPCRVDEPDLELLPPPVREKLRKLIDDEKLLPRIESDIDRETIDLRSEGGDLVELAFDAGSVKANGSKADICEVELELKEGRPEELYRIALGFADIVPMRIARMSKAERGFALLQGTAPAAVKADQTDLDKSLSAQEAYELILRDCLLHLLANEGPAFDARLPEGLHQLRVSLRRMRSAFTVFRKEIGGETAEMLSAEAKWLGNAVGRARDFDVFAHDILEPVTPAEGEEEAFAVLKRKVEEERARAWSAAGKAIHSQRYSRFVLQLALFLSERGWRAKSSAGDPVTDFAVRALDKRQASVERLGSRMNELDEEERHELRKRLKKLRYTLSFFQSLFGRKKAKPYLKDLSRLQDAFGALNDLATARAILGELAKDDAALQPAVAHVAEFHLARAEREWESVRSLWADFTARPAFWRG